MTLLRVVPLVLVVACGMSAPAARPGNPDVYARIASLTDCRELQKEFDTAEANGRRDREAGRLEQARASTSYMDAADARMKQVGCSK